MTARPVSALLHGFCYWFLGPRAWSHHTVNLSLFATSVLLTHATLCRTVDRSLAFVACSFFIVYPAASGTVFSAIMMNSNLAAAFWAAAIWVASTREMRPRTTALVASLLVASALSYESFVPLFPAVALAGGTDFGSWNGRRALRASWPVVIALCGVALYRLVLERAIFGGVLTRASIPHDLASRLVSVPLDGARVAFIDSIRISAHALRDLSLAPPIALGILACLLIPFLLVLWRSLTGPPGHGRRTLVIVAACVFLMVHFIFLGSEYRPTAHGFESRTQGAIRFGAGFLVASVFLAMTALQKVKLAARVICLGAFLLFTLGVVGQREAWIAAGRYNREVLGEIDSALRSSDLLGADSLTLVAVLDRKFSASVNGEPTFGTSWDLGPALEVAHPGLKVSANVYTVKRARVDPRGVTLDGSWRANFPFHAFRTGAGIRQIRSEHEWGEAMGDSVREP
ncbi:MAG TPA: hypothetical protein VJX91_02445 [Candidatus Eisenbacteria bacterium]|nr:hypothetical protein [Candidatus Eisenbacteria bacterium]